MPDSEELKRRSEKEIILGLIASNSFDFHRQLVIGDSLEGEDLKRYEEYWDKLEELLTSLDIEEISEHFAFLRNWNLELPPEEQRFYNFDLILLSDKETSDMAFQEAKSRIKKLKEKEGGYLTIHGAPLGESLGKDEFEGKTDRDEFDRLKRNLTSLTEGAGSEVTLSLETQGLTKNQIDELLKIKGLKLTWDIAHIYVEDQEYGEMTGEEKRLTPEDFFEYLQEGKIGMVHLNQPTMQKGVPMDTHKSLFVKEGLIGEGYLQRLFQTISKYNLPKAKGKKVRLVLECAVRLEDYKKIIGYFT